ncbi:MAG: hypothetical protein CMJ34_02765 [Phycisphaerae bacterium]|nr:hypothetical protein [Phycisphaerae bacterium]
MLPEPNDSKVLVIGWDAADWRAIRPLLEEGKMPNLQKMMDEGVHGNISTLNPVLSPMLWSSIATGKRPYKHGIHGFSEPTPDGKSVRPITNVSRKSKAVWNMLNQTGKKCNVVAWWPSHPAEPIDGVMVSNWYQTARQIKNADLDPEIGRPRPGAHGWKDDQWTMAPGTVHPPRLADNLQEFRFHPMELDPEHVGPFIPRFMEIDQKKDQRLSGFAKTLADTVSVHGAATALMQLEPWDFMAVYYDGIDHFGHGFMKYHPPRQEWIKEEDFEIYKGVVEGGYRFHDMMLGAMLQLAGPETTVMLLSDHGFHPDHLRPEHIPAEPAGPAIEHRPYGIFVARGPGIRAGETVQGASVLDLTPTVLACFGLPTGEDMDGKPLVTIFEDTPSIQSIPSWDEIDGPHPHGMHPPDSHLDSVQSAEAMKQLVELGYIDEPDEDSNVAVRETIRELHYNLAQAYMDGGRLPEAAELLQSIWEEWPHEHRFGLNHIACLNGMDRHVEVAVAIEQFVANVRSGSEWALNELEALRPEAEQYGVDLPRVKRNESEDAAQVAELDIEVSGGGDAEEASPREGEGEEQEKEKPAEEMPRKLSFRIRKVMSLLQPMRSTIEWMMLKNQIAMGNHTRAAQQLKRIMEEVADRRNPDLHNQIGFSMLDVDDVESARICFNRALEHDDENVGARQGLAEVALSDGEWDELIEQALTATELRFQNPRVHYLLARGLHESNDLASARIAYGVAIQQAPSFVEARNGIIELLEQMGEKDEIRAHREFLAGIEEGKQLERAVDADDIDTVWSAIAAGRAERRSGLFDGTGAPAEAAADAKASDHDPVTIVSGLPRSGTSMMMQMLVGGGLEPFTDDKREADSDNPRGYLEHEKATRIATDQSWVPEVRGGVFKLVAQLLAHLPSGERYRIVFMDRDLRDIVKSQEVMLERLGREGGRLARSRMMQTLDAQLAMVERLLARREDIDVLFVDYDAVISDPEGEARRIADFIGDDLDVKGMHEAVDASLRRQQSKS